MKRPAGAHSIAPFIAVVLLGVPHGVDAADWYLVCDRASKTVLLTQAVDASLHHIVHGPLAGRRTAEMWLDESCPSRTCDEWGRCADAAPPAEPPPSGAGGGWVAGEVTSVTLSGASAAPPSPSAAAGPAAPVGPAGVGGPGTADLSPLMENARAAVGGCAYPAALLTADHMAKFDPGHPWLVANHARLRDLAWRQKTTEDMVWQASSALSSGDLKRAQSLAGSAADTAVSCQSRAVSELLQGIGTAIAQRKAERSAANRQAAAALLPGLIDLAGVISGHQSGTRAPAPVGAAATLPTTVGAIAADPCAFTYEYRNVWNTTPVCTCPGYAFNLTQFRCMRR